MNLTDKYNEQTISTIIGSMSPISCVCATLTIVCASVHLIAEIRKGQSADKHKITVFQWIAINGTADFFVALVYEGAYLLEDVIATESWACKVQGFIQQICEMSSVWFTFGMLYACFRLVSEHSIDEYASLLIEQRGKELNMAKYFSKRSWILLLGSIALSVIPAVVLILPDVNGFGISGPEKAWCWIYVENHPNWTYALQISLMYVPVTIVLIAIISMWVIVKKASFPLDKQEQQATAASVFSTYLWIFVIVWFFPAIQRYTKNNNNAFLGIAHACSTTLKGTLNFFGFLYHFLLRPKLDEHNYGKELHDY